MKKAPKSFSSKLWDATAGYRNCLIAMPGTLGNFTPIHVCRLETIPAITTADRIYVVNFNAGGVAMTLVNGGSLLTFTNFFFDELQTQPPLSVRPSRKTFSVTNVTQSDNVEGYISVANIADGVPMTFNGGGSGGALSQPQWDALKAAATTHQSAKVFSMKQLQHTHKWSTCFASAITATEWINFAINGATMVNDTQRNSTSTLLVYVSQPSVEQSLRLKVDEQIACRFPSDSLLQSVSTDYGTTVPPSASQEHLRNGALPHQGPGGYM